VAVAYEYSRTRHPLAGTGVVQSPTPGSAGAITRVTSVRLSVRSYTYRVVDAPPPSQVAVTTNLAEPACWVNSTTVPSTSDSRYRVASTAARLSVSAPGSGKNAPPTDLPKVICSPDARSTAATSADGNSRAAYSVPDAASATPPRHCGPNGATSSRTDRLSQYTTLS
jgi:hypothetical protein